MHQPLHAADNDDRGGNEIRVEFMHHLTNLHAVWDSGILARPVLGNDREYALKLASSITPEQLDEWRDGTPVTWALESHEIAKRVIYGRLAHLPGQLPETYEAEALPIVNKQLEKAGVRLATLLNAVLK